MMSNQQSSAFDPERYAAAYPDVALSGLSPREHYRRFGRLLGRDPTGRTGIGLEAAVDSVDADTETGNGFVSSSAGQGSTYVPQSGEAIIGRPDDLQLERVRTSPADSKYAQEPIGLDALADGIFESAEERARICSPLAAYASLTSRVAPDGITLADDLCGQSVFQAGSVRIANIWFAGSKTLRLMINGPDGELLGAEGWSLRAYQALPDASGYLRSAGSGVVLPSLGPVFHDFELADRLMPVILELSGTDGETRGLTVLPFPSLLAGGVHAAELSALQSDANSMDAFWSLSKQLLREAIGEPGQSDRSIRSIKWGSAGQDATGVLAEVRDWVRAVFGLPHHPSTQDDAAVQLDLPSDCIPTIGALVARRIHAIGTGPYLVADSDTFRPRWSVAVPADFTRYGSLPQLKASKAGVVPSGPLPMHLAIALRDRPSAVSPSVNQKGSATRLPSMTVLIDGTDADRSSAMVQAIRAGQAEQTDILLRDSTVDGALDLNGLAGDVPTFAAERDLTELARESRHDLLLTISDRVDVDEDALVSLVSLLDDQNVASASCVLLGDVTAKTDRVARPAFGGIFPAGVSFISSPALSYSEPDVLQPLPQLVYPVVANTRHFTIWRASALAQLPPSQAGARAPAADVRLGLDLMAAGYRNVCSSRVMVQIHGPNMRQDGIDPVGPNYIPISDWQNILGRVTILRELF